MFSQRLKQLREEKGITQQELAQTLNIGRASISNYELGTRTPDIEILSKLADYFGVTTDYLIGKSDFRTNIDDEIEIKNQELKVLQEKIEQVKKYINMIEQIIID